MPLAVEVRADSAPEPNAPQAFSRLAHVAANGSPRSNICRTDRKTSAQTGNCQHRPLKNPHGSVHGAHRMVFARTERLAGRTGQVWCAAGDPNATVERGASAACGPVWAACPNHRITLLVPFWRAEVCGPRFSAGRRKPPAGGGRSPLGAAPLERRPTGAGGFQEHEPLGCQLARRRIS